MSSSLYMGSLLAAADAIGKDCHEANKAFLMVRQQTLQNLDSRITLFARRLRTSLICSVFA